MDNERTCSDQEKSSDYGDDFLEYEVNVFVCGDGTTLRENYFVHMGLYAMRVAPMDVHGYFRNVKKSLFPPPASSDASSSAQFSCKFYKLFGDRSPYEDLNTN